MLLSAFLAASAAATPPQQGPPANPPAIVDQATATVRIISGEWIRASKLPATAIVSTVTVRGADGIERRSRLVEFP